MPTTRQRQILDAAQAIEDIVPLLDAAERNFDIRNPDSIAAIIPLAARKTERQLDSLLRQLVRDANELNDIVMSAAQADANR